MVMVGAGCDCEMFLSKNIILLFIGKLSYNTR